MRLQWGPVVVTGISTSGPLQRRTTAALQWGPVVVTGIRTLPLLSLTSTVALQWGPVVVTGIRCRASATGSGCRAPRFNGGPVVVTGISTNPRKDLLVARV